MTDKVQRPTAVQVVTRITLGLIVVCILIVAALALLGPVALTLDGTLSDGGQCAQAIAASQSPGVELDTLNTFDLSVPGAVITTQNASKTSLLEQFTRPEPRFYEILAVDSPDQLLILQLPLGQQPINVANHKATKLVTIERHPHGMDSSVLRVCDMATSKQLSAFIANETTGAVAFTGDDSRFLINEGRGTVGIYDAQNYVRMSQWNVWGKNTNHLAVSPDGSLVALDGIESKDGVTKVKILLWDVAANSQLAVLEGHTNTMISLMFTPDGTRLVSYSMDGTVRVWGVPEP